MAIQQMGSTGVLQEVDPLFKAARVSISPRNVSAWSTLSAASGLITGAAAAAHLFSLRNLGSNLILLRRLSIAWVQTVAFTAAQRMEFGLYVARSVSVVPSGGTTIAASSGKHRTSLNTPNVEALIATTTGITAGTAVLDGNAAGIAAAWCTQGNPLPLTSLFSHDAGDHPLILAAGEGVRVVSLQAMTAAGVGVLYVNAEFAETDVY